jgi:hypothetical protein
MDKRGSLRANALQLEGERQTALALLRTRVPDLEVDLEPVTGAPRFVWSRSGFIQDRLPDGDIGRAEPQATIRAFLESNRALFGHGAEVLDSARITRDYVTPHSGMRTVVWQQELEGIPVFRAVLYGHVTKAGELVALTSQFAPNPADAADRGTPNRVAAAAQPPVSAETALGRAAGWLGDPIDSTTLSSSSAPGSGTKRTQTLQGGGLVDPVFAELVWMPISRDALGLSWRVVITSASSGELFQVVVDALTGEPLVSDCWTARISNASYRVFTSDSPSPMTPGHASPSTSQPTLASRSLQTLAALSTTASPNGWINDGETRTIGNNADARVVWTDATPGYDQAATFPRPDNSGRVFDYPWNSNQEPTTADNRNSAVVNAFYWANWMHDRLYDLGFTEAAGNFQQSNFGRGGIGGDAILVNVQHGYSSDVRNQNMMSTQPQDGLGPNVMKLAVFDGPNPDRDAGLQAETILHEYTHAMVQRLVGQGAFVSSAPQPWGINEGWADLFALTLLSQSTDNAAACYPFAAYTTYSWTPAGAFYTGATLYENYYYGKNTYPYSTDLSKHPVTLKDIDPLQASAHTGVPRNPVFKTYSDPGQYPQRIFDLWGGVLWEARAQMVAKHGFAAGNDLILRLVMDGMKIGPPNPDLLQARDAILLADLVYTGGANRNELWQAFAKRGMGWSATVPPYNWQYLPEWPEDYPPTPPVYEAFDLPPPVNLSGKDWNGDGGADLVFQAVQGGGIPYDWRALWYVKGHLYQSSTLLPRPNDSEDNESGVGNGLGSDARARPDHTGGTRDRPKSGRCGRPVGESDRRPGPHGGGKSSVDGSTPRGRIQHG